MPVIENLQIQNVALIANADLSFGAGLNILSGETGAGKSMLIDAINFVLGERPGKDFIRSGENAARVDALFSTRHQDVAGHLQELGVAADSGGALQISRVMSAAGKSVCRVNGKTVTISMLKELSAHLVDVHGQHEHQSLLNAARHITLLDMFCGPALGEEKSALNGLIGEYREVSHRINELTGAAGDGNARLSMLRFQCEEIEGAKLRQGEEEELLERRGRLVHLERLTNDSFEALALLSESDGPQMPATQQIGKALRLMRDIAELDNPRAGLADSLEEVLAQLTEIARDVKHYAGDLEHDPRELDDLETRLDLIHSLKRKYGGTVADVLASGKAARREMETLETSGETLAALSAEKKKLTRKIMGHCEAMSALRKESAARVTAQIVSVLRELGMKDAAFDVAVERKSAFGANGFDKVEFLISPNAGEPLKPLAAIASGGEMSRVMLALKTVLSDADSIETLIFDEIDAGVSGRTAQKVGEKLALIGSKRQILCITHLPQIAAMAVDHFLIEKRTEVGRTTTHVTQLDHESSVNELARLIGGARITDATMKAAGEMKAQGLALKNGGAAAPDERNEP